MNRLMTKWVVLMTCLAVSGYVASQPSADIKFERITTTNGLSNNQINDVFQDKQGYIWVGTLSGLNRYDGYNVKSFYHEEGKSGPSSDSPSPSPSSSSSISVSRFLIL